MIKRQTCMHSRCTVSVTSVLPYIVMMLLLVHASQHVVSFGGPSSALVQYSQVLNTQSCHAAFILSFSVLCQRGGGTLAIFMALCCSHSREISCFSGPHRLLSLAHQHMCTCRDSHAQQLYRSPLSSIAQET